MANTTLNSEYIADRYVANNTSCFRPVALLCSAREVLQKGFPQLKRNDTWVVPYNIVPGTRVRRYIRITSRPQNGRDSRTLQQIPTSPNTKELPPGAPALYKANPIFTLHGRVLLGEVLGERGRFGGREPRLSRGGSLPPRSSPSPSKVFRSFLLSRRESFNQRAELGAVGMAVKIKTA